MNKDAILYVADAIENHAIKTLGFNMSFFAERVPEATYDPGLVDRAGHGCGTVACVAGWTAALLTKDGRQRVRNMRPAELAALNARYDDPILSLAKDALGLTQDQASQLFIPDEAGDLSSLSPSQAVATLRRLARTGKVEWK